MTHRNVTPTLGRTVKLSSRYGTEATTPVGGNVELKVRGTDKQISKLAKDLPSTSSKDYGKPFAEIFKNYKGDFYAIDPNLFSPGKVTVTSLETNKIFVEGKLNSDLLDKSFGYEKS